MNKNVQYYERILKKSVEARTGKKMEDWLEPQLHAAALCWQMLEHLHESIISKPPVKPTQGSKEQWYDEPNPLLPNYKELQRAITLHYEALGINFKSKPANITEDTKKVDEEDNPMNQYYKR